jgi:hypothetical protein
MFDQFAKSLRWPTRRARSTGLEQWFPLDRWFPRDGTIAVSNYDHNEADTLGNAVLTASDPLAGYKAIAAQVAAAGITRITGEIIIDDRLFQAYSFRDEFDVRRIFVNDDVVDVSINPTMLGRPASVVSRPVFGSLRCPKQPDDDQGRDR